MIVCTALSAHQVHSIAIIAVCAAITYLLRALPFLVFRGKVKTPAFITYLSDVLPYAITGMLVVYCLKDISFASGSHGIPELISVTAVAGLHAWRKNTLLSVVTGTALYMVLIQNWEVITGFLLRIFQG